MHAVPGTNYAAALLKRCAGYLRGGRSPGPLLVDL